MKHIVFETQLQQTGWARALANSAGKPSIEVAIPPEFEGPEGSWTPEHLFLSSLESCLMATYSFIAKRHDLPIVRYLSRATGQVAKGPQGLHFTNVDLHVQIEVAHSTDLGVELLWEAAEQCPVHRAISVPIQIHPEVWMHEPRPDTDATQVLAQ